MNQEESTYELIERYLKQESSVSESKYVEDRMATDAAFAAEVEWFRQFRKDMQERTSFALLTELENIKQEDAAKRKKSVSLWIGILMVLLVLPIVWYITRPSDNDHSPLVEAPSSTNFDKQLPAWDQYLTYQTGLQNLGDEDDSNLKSAQQLMEAGQALQALPYLSKYLDLLPADDDDYEMRLEYGKILLRERFDAQQAKAVFKTIIEGEALPLFKEPATFYLGLSHFLSGQMDSTRLIWQEVINRADHPFHQQAREILSSASTN
ncbi:MAG: hypothetical protein KTR30_37895 [Saprospiraceae bacterium]|nr:hypothetical protein [Saprospiraceae bacterium]